MPCRLVFSNRLRTVPDGASVVHDAGQRYKNALPSCCKCTDFARSRPLELGHAWRDGILKVSILPARGRHVESTHRNLLLLLLTPVQGVECAFR